MTRDKRERIDDAEVLRLTRAGRSITEIARELSCSKTGVVRSRRRLGIARPQASAGLPPLEERLAIAERMIADGESWRSIRKTAHLHLSTLQKHFPGTGWTDAQRLEAARMGRALGRLPDTLARPA